MFWKGVRRCRRFDFKSHKNSGSNVPLRFRKKCRRGRTHSHNAIPISRHKVHLLQHSFSGLEGKWTYLYGANQEPIWMHFRLRDVRKIHRIDVGNGGDRVSDTVGAGVRCVERATTFVARKENPPLNLFST